MIVSPDVGGVVRARAIATRLNCDLAIIDKRRERAGVSEVMNVIGDVAGRDCMMVDDIVDSGGTLVNAAAALIEHGAASASVYVTHGVLSGGAVARIAASPIEMMTVTDSILATEAVRVATNIRQSDDRSAAGRGDAADQRREFRQLAVRLTNQGATIDEAVCIRRAPVRSASTCCSRRSASRTRPRRSTCASRCRSGS